MACEGVTLVQAVILAAHNATPNTTSKRLLSERAEELVFVLKFIMVKIRDCC
jgi:hypothetical protein